MMKRWILLCCVISLVACGNKQKVKRLESAQLHFRAAQELFLKDENIQALAEAKRAEELNKKDPQVQNFLGILYAQIEEFETAEMHMRNAVDLEPRYAEARVNLCGFLMRKNEYEEAIKHCKVAAEDVTYPNAERAYHNLGLMYEDTDRDAEAEKMFKKALIHNKNFVLSLESLGKMHFENKDYEQAQEFLSRADEACMASPKGAWGLSCPEAQYHLALTYFAMKNKKQGMTALQHCIETDPEDTLKKKCQNNLRMYR